MAHASHHDIEPPGEFKLPKAFNATAIAFVVIGLVAFVIGLLDEPGRAWRAYVIGMWFTLALGLCGPFFAATQYLSKAGWSVSIRRIPEAMSAYIYPGIVLVLIGLFFGADHLFGWLDPALFDPESSHFDEIVYGKRGFLNRTSLWLFSLIPLALAALLAFLMRKNSLAQDEEGGYELTRKNRWVSAFYIISFVVTVSFISWYWLMSYDPHWYSTMWNVYAFAGLFQSGLAVMTLVLLYLLSKGKLGGCAGTEQVHRMGQLVFAFTVFYAYIHFGQFILLWYADLPETAKWYVNRMDEHYGWAPLLLALPIFKFIVPFLALLRQSAKKNAKNVLVYMCGLLIVMQAFEIWFWVSPYWFGEGMIDVYARVSAAPTGSTRWRSLYSTGRGTKFIGRRAPVMTRRRRCRSCGPANTCSGPAPMAMRIDTKASKRRRSSAAAKPTSRWDSSA